MAERRARGKYPLKSDNVTMEDIRSGTRLRGVLIRPEIQGETDENGKMRHRIVEGNYYVVTPEATAEGERMDAFVPQDIIKRISEGEEVNVKSHLTSRIDLRWVIGEALKDVLSSKKLGN